MTVWGIRVLVERVSYRRTCPNWRESGHEKDGSGPDCTGECTWMDGDKRVLRSETIDHEPDKWDMEEYGTREAWAVATLRRHHPELTDRSDPDNAGPSTYLHGSYEDPYEGDWKVREVTAWLTGGWPAEVRGRVFDAAVRGDQRP